MWIVTGPFWLAYYLIRDTIVFVIHLYRKDLDTNYYELKSEHFVSNTILEQIAGILNGYTKDGNRIVEVTTAITDIRTQIKVDQAIFMKVYGQTPKGMDQEAYSVKRYEEILQAFNIIKKMLVNNSSRIENFDEIIKDLVDDPSLVQVRQTTVNVIDCQTILAFINNILTIRVLHKVLISGETDLFSKPLEKRKVLLKELETLYGTYKIDNDLLSDRIVKQLELYMTKSIAYCNTRRIFDVLDFSPKNEKFLTKRSIKDYDKIAKEENDGNKFSGI